MLRALLVDDEPNNLDNLEFMLTHDCAGIAVANKARSADEARQWLAGNDADVIFLDIQMPGETGFDLLNTLAPGQLQSIKIVFVTAYDTYALKAIKASAIDYLLKPVNIDELRHAVEKVKEATGVPVLNGQQHQLIKQLLRYVNNPDAQQRIALPHLGGVTFVNTCDIVSLQADSNYTIIHLSNMQKMVISKTLKDFDELLDHQHFTRIHKSYTVNLDHIKEYSTADGGVVKMIDGNQWSISRRLLDSFLEKMKKASLMFNK
ncbi:response regulator transcription factor [Mucilaginibacter mali]|uniref:Response regulator transcription factor n=1 Tax=Mucilaginibacter mali TaxID=2740462 RepID=A0A7D4UBB7_9SPHI|nr:LytTR family DNA-binding domain-containing protein [Mucilaginibacter mali]QKJ30598.1 response regulator transcription factor [Mucilaginibacter mali]